MRIVPTVILCTLAFCCSTLVACRDKAPVALVNPLTLIRTSLSGKAAVDHLSRLEADIQRQLEEAQKIIEKQPGNEKIRLRIQEIFTVYQRIVNREQSKVTEGINLQMKIAMEIVRTRKKLDVILSSDNALAFADDKDVTTDVLTEMDKSPLDFRPVVIPPIGAALHEKQTHPNPTRKQ